MDAHIVDNNIEVGMHCQFFVTRKHRYCRMTVKEGRNYCGEHENYNPSNKTGHHADQQRIVCPNDGKHTCYAHQLEKHLKKCNARLTVKPVYIVPGINRDINCIEPTKRTTLAEIEDADLTDLIGKIMYLSESVSPISELVFQHSVLIKELENPEYGPSTRKHLLQNASLLGYVEHSGLIQDNTCFVEFGAGRGQLSFWLGEASKQNQSCLLLLVDRASHKHKLDKRHRDTASLSIVRVRADIADLCLKLMPPIQSHQHVVAVSKHLCGEATDLALRCLTAVTKDGEETPNISGLVMAPCCHHGLHWSSYTGKKYLMNQGFSARDFDVMCGIASWATCGMGIGKSKRKECNETTGINRYTKLNLTQEDMKSIGRKCKIILDYGRLQYLEEFGLKGKITYYINQEISPENLCIVALKVV